MQFNNLSNQVYASKTASILIIIIVKMNLFLQCDSLGKVKSILIRLLLRTQIYRHPSMHSRSSSIRPNTPRFRIRSGTSLSDPLPHGRSLSLDSNLLSRPATSSSARVSTTNGVQSPRQNPVIERQLKVTDKDERARIHAKGKLIAQWKSTVLSSNFGDCFSGD